MEERERKVYEIKGTVQISSEEYRGLIEEVADMKIESAKNEKNYWNLYSEKNKVEKALEEKTTAYDELFAKYTKLKELILNKLSKDDKNDVEEDSKGTFIAMFAEFFKD